MQTQPDFYQGFHPFSDDTADVQVSLESLVFVISENETPLNEGESGVIDLD